jgi:tRNA threonylcarbamoyladenosine biosynthesis protein TsaB
MLTLSIDVMTKESCVALWKSDKSIQKPQKFIKKISDNGNSEIIFEIIEELFSKSIYKINEIDRVITINGPGNYSNIRIGLAVTKGFSIALDIPYFAISSHELIANLAIKKDMQDELLVLIDAKNDSFYTQYFNINQNSKTEITLESFESIKKKIKKKKINIIERDIAFLTLCIKNNYSPTLLESNVEIPEFLLAEIGSKLEINNINVEPLYIRQPNAKIPENVKIYKNE